MSELHDIADEVKEIFKSQKISKYHCVIFDIDDTLINTYSGRVIEPMKELYNFFVRKGIRVYILTARDPYYRFSTEDQLGRNGINQYKELFMVGNTSKGREKRMVRKMIESKGYKILFNIGDSDSDFEGGHSLYKVKIPRLH